MDEHNVVVLRGRVSADPMVRELASGAVVAQFDVTVTTADGTTQVPVAWFDPPEHRRPVAGRTVVVLGSVRRRFFRTGGATASRTEVVAERIVDGTRRRDGERLVADAVARLTG